MTTIEAYLENDGNVTPTADQLFTHRHTVRYRLERVKELCGHDITSTEGREKLGLGLKAMRVLGIAAAPRPGDGARHRGRPGEGQAQDRRVEPPGYRPDRSGEWSNGTTPAFGAVRSRFESWLPSFTDSTPGRIRPPHLRHVDPPPRDIAPLRFAL